MGSEANKVVKELAKEYKKGRTREFRELWGEAVYYIEEPDHQLQIKGISMTGEEFIICASQYLSRLDTEILNNSAVAYIEDREKNLTI